MDIKDIEIVEQRTRDTNRKLNLGFIIFIISTILVLSCIYIIGKEDGEDKLNTKTYARLEVQEILKDYVIYPDTLKIKTIEYYKSEDEEAGTELWKCQGYFVAESKIGLEVKNEYIVYITYSHATNTWRKGTVFIDGKLMT